MLVAVTVDMQCWAKPILRLDIFVEVLITNRCGIRQWPVIMMMIIMLMTMMMKRDPVPSEKHGYVSK